MKRSSYAIIPVVALIAALAAALLPAAATVPAARPFLAGAAAPVPITVRVFDDNTFVPGLTLDDFELLESGCASSTSSPCSASAPVSRPGRG